MIKNLFIFILALLLFYFYLTDVYIDILNYLQRFYFEILNAWELWWQQKLPKSFTILNLNITSWSRIGKVLQFIAIFTLVLELIGAEKINKFGNKIKLIYKFNNSKLLKQSVLYWFSLRRDLHNLKKNELNHVVRKKKEEEIRKIMYDNKIENINMVLSLIFSIIIIINIDISYKIIVFLLLLFVLNTIIIPLLIFVFIFVISILIYLFDNIIIYPIVQILSNKNLNWSVKLFTLITAIIGFHFDFLSS